VQFHSKNQALSMLHIDDNPNDRLLVKEAILLTGTPFTFYEADNPDAAMAYFELRAPRVEHNQTPRPAIVLLDYDMGMHTGLDFLHWLRV
jgi:two-component system, chemotaxis family, response regulator Rcp1